MYVLLFSAVTSGLCFNGTMVIVTVGVTITATAILLSIRCVRKRAARRSVPVQVGEFPLRPVSLARLLPERGDAREKVGKVYNCLSAIIGQC